jgi:hypothetical protein
MVAPSKLYYWREDSTTHHRCLEKHKINTFLAKIMQKENNQITNKTGMICEYKHLECAILSRDQSLSEIKPHIRHSALSRVLRFYTFKGYEEIETLISQRLCGLRLAEQVLGTGCPLGNRN